MQAAPHLQSFRSYFFVSQSNLALFPPRSNVRDVKAASFTVKRTRPLFSSRVPAGFPSPSEDYIEGRLDLNRYLIKHPVATFYVRVSGDSMIGANIQEGDLLVVDRAEEAQDGNIIVARIFNELCIKRFRIIGERLWLFSENERYHPIEITEAMDFEVWGKVLYSIHQH